MAVSVNEKRREDSACVSKKRMSFDGDFGVLRVGKFEANGAVFSAKKAGKEADWRGEGRQALRHSKWLKNCNSLCASLCESTLMPDVYT